MPIDYEPLYQILADSKAKNWAPALQQQLDYALHPGRHGNLTAWLSLLEYTHELATVHRVINEPEVAIGLATDLSGEISGNLLATLKAFKPWRKGPFQLFGIHIDSEWRSDWKWQRLTNHIKPLFDRKVLDVGCGNGYFCWRMLGERAKLVVGVDPLMLNVMQFQLVKNLYGGNPPVFVLPFGIETLPAELKFFDTVFSMGVLYHRRSPIDHLLELKSCLVNGGELVLETLVVDGGQNEVLLPETRYANMRNVWFIPSCAALTRWLTRCGYRNIRLVDVTKTTTAEQRTTEWMPSQSLADFLNPDNPNLTCEGLPAPKRAIFIAEA